MAARARSYCFTLFDAVEHPWEDIFTADGIKYLIVGDEICPDTGRRHWQGYVEFTNGRSLASAKNVLQAPAIHLESRRGTAQEASDYCTKDKRFLKFGTISAQGKRTDIDDIRTVARETGSMRAICERATSYQAIKCGEMFIRHLGPKRKTPPHVDWYCGPTGTDKTRTAIAEAGDQDYWMSNGSLRWFDGYDGQLFVIFDDFRAESSVPYQRVLKLLDRYPVRVEVKGSSVELLATRIIVTSTFSPDTVYDGKLPLGESIDQLKRRIHNVRHFGAPLQAWAAGH